MISYRKILVCLLSVTALLFAAGASAKSDSIRPENKVPGAVESTAQRLRHALLKQGFEVSRGYFKLWGTDQCQYTFDRLGLCFGNNPAAPYVTFAVPPWPNEFVDEKISSVWGPSHAGYDDVLRLDPREAIIILAQMPPPARYFSEQSFVFTRKGTYDTNSDTYQNIANDPDLPNFILPIFFRNVPEISERIILFASLSNPINNVVIERQSQKAFDQIRYFIITPDDFMNQAVRDAFAGISVKDEDIFTEPIPSDMKVGLDRASDDFVTLIRYAQPDDGGAPGTPSDTWRKNLPLVVLRVRDTRHEPQPYTTPVQLEARTAFDEYTLQSDLISLVSAVHRRWTGQPCAKTDCSDLAKNFFDFQTYPIYMVGPLCTPIGENCLGDNWDAAYQIYGRISVDDGEIYAVAGTLGTRTGNATYVGLSINQISLFKGVANLSDKVLDGTANGYAGEVKNTGYFYLYYFARDCSGLEDLTGGHCFNIDKTLIPQGDSIVLGLRDYVRPGTQRGPDSSLVLPPMVIQLQRP